MQNTAAAVRLRFPRMPIAIQFTRQGWIFVFLSLAIGAAAVNTGNNVLYLIFSLTLGLIVVSGMASRRVLLHLHPEVEFPPQMFSGASDSCYITVRNGKKRTPSIGIQFEIQQEGFPSIRRYFFFIPAGSEVHAYAPAVFPHRGVYLLREMELRTRFPFSFLIKIRRYFPEQEVKVYPRIYRLTDEMLMRFAEGMLLESPYRGESHQLLHLRAYTPQDSSKRIHWKASAKTERLVVKEYQREQGRNIHLYFDCYPGGTDEHPPALEAALSLVGSIAFLISEKGITGKIHFPDAVFNIGPGATLAPLLEYMTVMGTEPPAGEYGIPDSAEAMILHIRSRRIPTRLLMQWSSIHPVYVEEWIRWLNEASGGAR